MPLAALRNSNSTARVLQAYLLGQVPLDDALALQRRLVYDAGGDRSTAFLLLCEHPPAVTIGRSGSFAHLRVEPETLRTRRWDVRRVNRGGGCLLHVPGQLVGYVILALDAFALNVQQYLDQLHALLADVLSGLEVPVDLRAGQSGVWCGARRVAHVGVAVRDWVSSFGFAINVQPDLAVFREVHCDGEPQPMTSVQRERRLPVRPATIRQRLVEAFSAAFAFDRVALFHSHPSLSAQAPSHAVPSGSR